MGFLENESALHRTPWLCRLKNDHKLVVIAAAQAAKTYGSHTRPARRCRAARRLPRYIVIDTNFSTTHSKKEGG